MFDDSWTPLDESEHERVWSTFYDRFQFKASHDSEGWPGFVPPMPSITFDLSAIPEGPQLATAADAINAEALRCFVTVLPDGGQWIVLDWQHTAYRFDAVAASLSDGHTWSVSVYPDGDYYSFLLPDMTSGTFGHPWEQTLCIFGTPLVDTLGVTLASWLPVKRRSRA